MYANPERPGKYCAPRRRRTRRKKTYRLLYAVNFLLLIFAAVQVLGSIREQKRTGPGFITRAEAVSDSKDTTAPVIHGVADILLYTGDTAAYRSGVTVSDDKDAAPTLEVDNSQVDLSRPGSYVVTYRASDAAGNQSTATATVTVLEKQAGFVDVETIYQAADAELSGILTEGMTQLQQVVAIYDWARSTRHYGGHSTRSDWLQAAYEMLTTGQGDCYGYFAVTKLMFERLDIPNIDVQKVKISPEDSAHFWSLVSVDGGSSYYHFDATPRLGGSNFCLVTDAYLDEYSATHDNSHNRDKSLYPATPEE